MAWPVWTVGLIAAVAAIHLARSAGDWPSRSPDFDQPIGRVLVQAFAWGAFSIVLIFAVALDGVVAPPALAAILWLGGRRARRRASFERVRWLAAPLAALGFIAGFALFQHLFGESFFGLPGMGAG